MILKRGKNMGKKFLLFVAALIFIFSLASSNATVGIGLGWFTEQVYAKENSIHCVEYVLYNPFDTDVFGYLSATKELQSLAIPEEAKLIPANTSVKNAIKTRICFNIPKVYPEHCAVGIICWRSCKDVEEKVFEGEVVAAYTVESTKPHGSVVGSSVSAPLKIIVKCEEKEKEKDLVLIILAIAILAIIIWLIVRRFVRKKKKSRKTKEKKKRKVWR